MPVAALGVLQGIAAVAGLVASLKSIFEDHDELNQKLDDLLRELQGLRVALIRALSEVLEAIDGIRRQIDEDVANDAMTLADRALYSDRAIFDDVQEAMGNSFQAADRLGREVDVVFAGPFMYVTNIRLTIMKDFDPNYFCQAQFREEFQGYRDRLSGWIDLLNGMISRSHTVSVTRVTEDLGGGEPGTVAILRFWRATHLRDGLSVISFDGSPQDLSEAARTAVERKANASRDAGIEADRRELGVVAMEQTLAAWEDAFEHQLRLSLVSQVLSRPVRAIDANRQGLMVDGRLLAGRLDQRSMLLEVLASREFQRRVQRSWDAFVAGGDARLAHVAHRRLFGSDATEENVALLRDIASGLGFAAFVAALLYSDEYTTRYGNGLPGGGAAVIPELEKAKPSSSPALHQRSGTRSSKSRSSRP